MNVAGVMLPDAISELILTTILGAEDAQQDRAGVRSTFEKPLG